MNAIYFNIKNNGKVSNRGAYVVLGIDLEEKDILSSVTGENESSKFWLKVVNKLKSRSIAVFTVPIHGLKGFSDAILIFFLRLRSNIVWYIELEIH